MSHLPPAWRKRAFSLTLSLAAVGVSLLLWFAGLLNSPVIHPELAGEEQFLKKFITANSPDLQAERALAHGYWRRYPDIRDHSHWGEKGPMGIWGARDHYQQHGRREGRIFQPVLEPEDPELERQLAEAYWRRYPDIRDHLLWGEDSSLGFLGPRDYHIHVGRQQGRVWGLDP
jgi:hypothetical protein